MKATIENTQIKVEVEAKGAQVVSLKNKETDLEYIWKRDPQYWKSCAINLFPICGRLEEGRYTYKGQSYQMNPHGFARNSEFEIEKISECRLRCILKDNDETRQMYPFSFEYIIEYVIDDYTLSQNIYVRNTGTEILPFAVGGHPGFNVPLTEEERFEDYYLEFDSVEEARKIDISERGLLTGESIPFPMEDGRRIYLSHNMFDDDAIFLENISKGITLRSAKSEKRIYVSFPNMKYLGIWHTPKSEAPFLCIEPWIGLPSYDGKVDDILTKEHMVKLTPGDEYTNGFSISIE